MISIQNERRKFLMKALVGGGSLALLPKNANSAPSIVSNVIETVLPTVVDSLIGYAELAHSLPGTLTHRKYDKLNRTIAVDIQTQFSVLGLRLNTLMASNESFKHDPKAKRLVSAITIGTDRCSALIDRYNVLDASLVSVIADYVVISSFCQPETNEKFRKTWADTSQDTTLRLSKLTESLESLTSTARLAWGRAMEKSLTIADDLKAAADRLSDNMQESQSRTLAIEYISRADAALLKLKASWESSEEIDRLRALLSGCVSWIKRGGKLDEGAVTSREERAHAIGTFNGSNASARAGLWGAVRQVLADILPANSATRAFACVVLIAPILIGYEDQRTRFDLIYDVLPDLLPRGDFDMVDEKRKSAADRLSRHVL